MRTVTQDAAADFGRGVLIALGASEGAAIATADHLAQNELSGYPSHGLARLPQYAVEIESGEINPIARPSVVGEMGGHLQIDGLRALGPYAVDVATEAAIAIANAHGVFAVNVSQCGHAGRLGAYVERLAMEDVFALAFCSGPAAGHRVAPFGGIEGRFATNPIAYAAPTMHEPIVADFSTSAVPEGRVRLLAATSSELKPGILQDASGLGTIDPSALYANPPGTLLPLGGPDFGYKGTALGLLVELMATTLAGESTDDPSRVGNSVTLLGVKVGGAFRARATNLVDYVKSSAPRDPARPVLVPGEPEQRARQAAAISVPDQVLESLAQLAARLGVDSIAAS